MLAGKPNEGAPHLRRVISMCSGFDDAMLMLRARWYLGMAAETSGDLAGARSAYQQVADTWPKSSGSRTLKAASERLLYITRK